MCVARSELAAVVVPPQRRLASCSAGTGPAGAEFEPLLAHVALGIADALVVTGALAAVSSSLPPAR